MHDLEVPLALPRRRVEADQRLPEQRVAGAPAAVVVVARSAHRHVQQPALFVERHRRPHVGVAGERPRIVTPGVIAELARLRNRVKAPRRLPGACVERANVARRVVAVHQPVADAAAEDHQILVDDRRRGVRVVLLLDRPDEPVADVDRAVAAEGIDRQAGLRVEAEEVIPAVHEDAQPVAVAPGGDAAMDETLPARRRAFFVGLGIEHPQLAACLRVERRYAVVRRAHVQHVIDHERRVLEGPWRRAELGHRHFPGLPFPGNRQAPNGFPADLGERRVLGSGLIPAIDRPLVRALLGRATG